MTFRSGALAIARERARLLASETPPFSPLSSAIFHEESPSRHESVTKRRATVTFSHCIRIKKGGTARAAYAVFQSGRPSQSRDACFAFYYPSHARLVAQIISFPEGQRGNKEEIRQVTASKALLAESYRRADKRATRNIPKPFASFIISSVCVIQPILVTRVAINE